MLRVFTALLASLLVAFVVAPLAALVVHLSPSQLFSALATPVARAALVLSLGTTLATVAVTLALGTPLALVLARARFRGLRVIDAVVDLPIVVPPAVAGLGLLLVFGRSGIAGPALAVLGIHLSFSTAAVVMAQTLVASPFYVRAARAGFLAVDPALEAASATLGMGPLGTFARVTVPLALPALLGGALLCWARALGEFGATIMFAGNLLGVSQTLPLAVYLNLESGDIPVAVALSVLTIAVGLGIVFGVRLLERP